MATQARDLAVDRLPDQAEAPIQVFPFADIAVGEGAGETQRPPHRHDYHELVWVREGSGRHTIDHDSVDARPHTLESDYARHHDAAHYAHALAVPAPALSRRWCRRPARRPRSW